MTKIPTRNIHPGMIVKNDVKDRNGRILLPQNSSIEEKHIRVFKMWGIFEVDIEQSEDDSEEMLETSNLSSKEIKKASKIISPKYAKSNINNPGTKALFKQNALLVAKNLNKGEDAESDDGLSLPDTDGDLEQEEKFFQEINLNSILDNEIKLFTLPDIFYRLTEIINNPRSSARDISYVVEKDTALTARILKLVNSPFYGFPQKIETISKAVTIIGTKQLTTLAMGISVLELFDYVPSNYLDMEKFWKHCLAVGICAKLISEQIDYSESEKLFVGGIMHDIGRLVMLKKIPKQTAAALKYAWDNDMFLSRAEKKCIGLTHSKIGSDLCDSWKLPPILVDMIKYHHQPAQGKYNLECSIIHLAEVIVNALEIGTSGEKMVLYLNEKSWKNINMSSNAIPPIIEQLNNEIDPILELMR